MQIFGIILAHEAQRSLGWADRTAHIQKPARATSGGGSNDSQSDCSFTCYSDAAISNATINARIRYGNSAHIG